MVCRFLLFGVVGSGLSLLLFVARCCWLCVVYCVFVFGGCCVLSLFVVCCLLFFVFRGSFVVVCLLVVVCRVVSRLVLFVV